MAKGNKDLELLIKMMGQFGNENDNIVCGAARSATKQLAKLGVGSWEEFCRGHFTIAADPFEGLSMPQFGQGQAAPPPPAQPQFRRGYASNPGPMPNPQSTTVPPRPSAQPQPNPQSAGSGSPHQSYGSRYNKYRAVCHKCGSYCNPNEGYLDGKGQISGQTLVKCVDSYACANRAAKAAKPKRGAPKGAAAQSVDNIMNMIDN